MDWKWLERWVTTALYVAGGGGIVILLVKRLAPRGSLSQRIASEASSYLSELGSISSGLIIIVVLAILGGSVIMVSIFAGVNKYREFKENERRRKEERETRRREREARIEEATAEGIAQGREQGIAQGRATALADVRTRLVERGIDPDDILPPEENGSEPSQ